MASFRFSEFEILEVEPGTRPLKGNLEPADERNLRAAQPKDLKENIGHIYLIYDRGTHERIKGIFSYVGEIDAIYTNQNQPDGTHFMYVFDTDIGHLFIESESNYNNIDEEDEYGDNIKFNPKFGVFIPKSDEIVVSKLRIPEDTQNEILEYSGRKIRIHIKGGGKSKKSTKSRKSRKLRKI